MCKNETKRGAFDLNFGFMSWRLLFHETFIKRRPQTKKKLKLCKRNTFCNLSELAVWNEWMWSWCQIPHQHGTDDIHFSCVKCLSMGGFSSWEGSVVVSRDVNLLEGSSFAWLRRISQTPHNQEFQSSSLLLNRRLEASRVAFVWVSNEFEPQQRTCSACFSYPIRKGGSL